MRESARYHRSSDNLSHVHSVRYKKLSDAALRSSFFESRLGVTDKTFQEMMQRLMTALTVYCTRLRVALVTCASLTRVTRLKDKIVGAVYR